MNIADEIRKLHELRQSGALTDEEFATAKAAVLAQGAAAEAEPPIQAHLEEIKRQNEVAELDRQWALERERYMVTGRHGHGYGNEIPSQGMSVLGGVFIVGFGLLWTILAASIGAPVFFPLFGVLFILFGIGASVHAYTKATEYEQAQKRYQRRRAQLRHEGDES